MKTILKKILSVACVYYTVGTLLLFIALAIATLNEGDQIPNLLNVILIFPFCVAFAAVGELCARKPFSPAACRLIHFGTVALAFLFFLWLPSGANKTFGSSMIALVLFSFVYWVIHFSVRLTVKRFHSYQEE